MHQSLDFTLHPRTTRLGVWTSKTRTSLVHWTSGFQIFFLILHGLPFVSHIWVAYGALLGSPSGCPGCRSSAIRKVFKELIGNKNIKKEGLCVVISSCITLKFGSTYRFLWGHKLANSFVWDFPTLCQERQYWVLVWIVCVWQPFTRHRWRVVSLHIISTCFLGVITLQGKDKLSSLLTFLYCIEQLLFKFIPSEVMVNIYKAFILPHLEYCAPVLVGLSSGLSNKLELTNQYAIRTLLNMVKSNSYSTLLDHVGLKTLEHPRYSYALCLFYKCLYNMGPNNIREMFLFRTKKYMTSEASASLISLSILPDSCIGHTSMSLQDYGIICLTM